MAPEALQKARGKLNIMRILGGPEPDKRAVDQMSDDLQQLLNKSVDLYATDVGKWVKIFWSDPILERRVQAISEIGWGAYLCGELMQIDLAKSEGFLEGVFKLARTMCGRPVAPELRATTLHSIGLMCRDCVAFQERALGAGILSVASDYLTDKSPTVRKSSASLLFVLFVGHARRALRVFGCAALGTALTPAPPQGAGAGLHDVRAVRRAGQGVQGRLERGQVVVQRGRASHAPARAR